MQHEIKAVGNAMSDLNLQAASGTEQKESPITALELDICIKSGKGLVVKDKKLFGKGSSDPYCKILCGGQEMGKTKVITKNVSPVWNEQFKIHLPWNAKNSDVLKFAVFDYDQMSASDPMGEVELHLTQFMDGKVSDQWYNVKNCHGCTDASGDLNIKIACAVRRSINMKNKQTMPIPGGVIAVGMGWVPVMGTDGKLTPVDLDSSCVAVAGDGRVLMEETVYFADHTNVNGSIRHSGDEKEGDEDLGDGDDEVIMIDLDKVPKHVLALFVIGTVATPGRTFDDVRSSHMRVVGCAGPHTPYNIELCRYYPASKGPHTALFLCRIARNGGSWLMSTIGDVDHTARDFGTLIPEIKMYMADILPSIRVDPNERVGLMRKGGIIRLRDYFGPLGIPKLLTFGLAWDITNGQNIDLDASALMMDGDMKCIDTVYFRRLKSADSSIQHCGDEREGDEAGDDEKINCFLGNVSPSVAYIGFTINSFSGQELDDVSKCACHLFDPLTKMDVAAYKLTGTKKLDKKTSLLIAMLFRHGGTGEWCLQIMSKAGLGRTADACIPLMEKFIRKHPQLPLGPTRPIAAAAGALLASAPGGQSQLTITVPSGMMAGQQLVVHSPKGPMWVVIPPNIIPGQTFVVVV